ncbi:hypothetical protein Bbelb_053010 [Branchiostoma belcheri]|nr:hypothetical protein Bbelb_053010 [Branchiostoma belcheri]
MGISDNRRKGKGCREIHSNFVLVWSGVEMNQRAVHGVAIILHPDTAKCLSDTVYISERIIKITIKEKDNTSNYFQIYAPCNYSYTEEEKDRFFSQLSDSISEVPDEEEVVVMGDFNGRVGSRRDPWSIHLGPHSDGSTKCNYNGHQLLSLCAEHDLVITNTLFQHRPSHRQTWYQWNDLTVLSQIDFILTRASRRATIRDARSTCGTKRRGRQRKATKWWNDEGKEAVKEKKKMFKIWVKSQRHEDYVNYRFARRRSKRAVRDAKDDSWKAYGQELRSSTGALELRDEPFNPTSAINDRDGNPLYEEHKISQRWQEYFEELLNPREGNTSNTHFTPSFAEHTEPNILEEEVQRAVQSSPKNKAAGIDGIPIEAITACGETGIKWLTGIFQKVWVERCVPEDWRKSIVVPIWKKKGNKKDCSTYRGISLISHTGKTFAKILEQRTRAIVDPLLSEAQFGFRKGRGCTDAIFELRQLSEKAYEYQKHIHLVFVDQEKAFDRVNRNKLWEILEQYGVKGQLLENIRALYFNSQSAVQTPNGLSNWFWVRSGVRQGCVLSPLLFIVYMDRITQEANPDPVSLNELLFADDQGLLNESKAQLQHHTDNLNRACRSHDMKISIGKTEAMSVGRCPEKLEITVNGQPLKQTTEFKYLGSIFTEDGKMDREIETRIQKANSVSYQLAPLLKHPSMSMDIKAKLINTIFVPTLTYQCQTWTLSKTQERKLTSCEMRCLRRAAGKTRRDRVRNEVIRQLVGNKPVLQFIAKQRVQWFGHLMRMPTTQPALRAYTTRHSGVRARGRPRRQWIDGVAETLSAHGMTLREATHLAVERRLHLPTTPHQAQAEG